MLPGSHSDIRYYLLVNYLKSVYLGKPLILEVGSGPVGFSHYWKGSVVGLDINIRKGKNKNLKLVNGTAIHLPFLDKKFDFTLSVDFLEHIPFLDRKKAVLEMIRVTKGDILIGVPCGSRAKKWENKARKTYEEKIKWWEKKDPDRASLVKQKGMFLSEHKSMSLPSEEALSKMIKESVRESIGHFDIEVIDNESLWVWYFYLLAELKYNYFRWFITTMLTLIMYPFLRRAKWGGYYRKIFIIKKGK